MGTTLTALTSASGIRLVTVVAIEGYGYLLTDHGTPSDVVTAWSGSDWTAALSGLTVEWNIDDKLSPWQPFDGSNSSVTLRVMDASGTNADTFGIDVFNKENLVSSKLTDHDIEPDTASVIVGDTTGFDAAPSTCYIGCEAIGYDSIGGGTFGTLTRGKWSPFQREDGGGYARTHRMADGLEGVDADATFSTTVASKPIDWRGRWVGVWLHRLDGSTLDTKANAHLAFAGKIANVKDAGDGSTIVECMSLGDVLKESVILRDQWRGRLAEGIYLTRFAWFDAEDGRTVDVAGTTVTFSGDADRLRVVAAGTATPPYEIDEGFYTGYEIEAAINAWLAQAKSDSDLLFNLNFSYLANDGAGPRSRLHYSDPSTAAGTRRFRLTADREPIRTFLGWDADGIGADGRTADSGAAFSAAAPQRIAPIINGLLHLDNVQGSFADQSVYMRPRWRNNISGTAVGFIRIGSAIIPCATPTGTTDDTSLDISEPINSLISAPPTDWPNLSTDEDGFVQVEQVLILDGTFRQLVLSLLASTGSASGLNWPDYDVLPAHCSAAIPYDLLGNTERTLEDAIYLAPAADDALTLIVEKPTRLPDLLNASFVLRGGLQFVWRSAGLTLKAFATPTSTATLTIASDDRAAPLGTVDDQRAVTSESEEDLFNVVTIAHNGNPFTGEYRDTLTLADPAVANYGARIRKITARNASSGAELTGEDVYSLVSNLAAIMTFLARPQTLINVPISFNLFETCTPGEVCLFSDPFARDPATGTRSMSGRPALVVARRYQGWGGTADAVGELTLMIFPRLSLAPYCPAGMVDDGAAGGGYNAGTKVLTLKAHGLSDTSDVADATRFPATSKVRVMQRDPANPAAPLTWDDIVASQSGNTITLTTGLAGFDSTKLYYVYSDDYGDATTTQQANAYQADDADMLVANARAAYALGHFGGGQLSARPSFIDATSLPDRPADGAYGDGVALDTAHARAVSVGLNNGISYKWAPQQPEITEEMTFSGGGTWQLVWWHPVYVGIGRTTGNVTRYLYIGPHIASASGTASVRVTVCPNMPTSDDANAVSRDDIVRVAPYEEHTFTTNSATYATATPYAFPIDHLSLGDGPLGGWAWCLVELGANAKFRGFGAQYVGPLVMT